MKDFFDVLDAHKQLYQNSCTSSGREVVLKLHKKVAFDWYDLQRKYQDKNIGFDQLEELAVHGVVATSTSKPIAEAYVAITREVREGRFPLVSLPFTCRVSIIDFSRQRGPYHIYVAGPAIVSGLDFGFYSPNPSLFPGHSHLYDIAGVASALEELGPCDLSFATYAVS